MKSDMQRAVDEQRKQAVEAVARGKSLQSALESKELMVSELRSQLEELVQARYVEMSYIVQRDPEGG